jgi:hypothetical protein
MSALGRSRGCLHVRGLGLGRMRVPCEARRARHSLAYSVRAADEESSMVANSDASAKSHGHTLEPPPVACTQFRLGGDLPVA